MELIIGDVSMPCARTAIFSAVPPIATTLQYVLEVEGGPYRPNAPQGPAS